MENCLIPDKFPFFLMFCLGYCLAFPQSFGKFQDGVAYEDLLINSYKDLRLNFILNGDQSSFLVNNPVMLVPGLCVT